MNVCPRMGWDGTQALVTPLMTAADNGNEGTVRILLHSGADVHAENQVAVHAVSRIRWRQWRLWLAGMRVFTMPRALGVIRRRWCH